MNVDTLSCVWLVEELANAGITTISFSGALLNDEVVPLVEQQKSSYILIFQLRQCCH